MNPILKNLGIPLLIAGIVSCKSLSAQDSVITITEAEKLSDQLESSVGNSNPEILNQLLSFPEFIKRMKSHSSLIDNVDTLTKIARAFGLFNIGNHEVEISKNGSYHLVRGYMKDEEMHLLFRAFGDGGLNYQDITIVKIKAEIKAVDIFSYELGQPYTTLFSALLKDKEPENQHISLTAMDKYLRQFEYGLKVKNYSAARSAFEKLDENAQNDKPVFLKYIQVCEHLDSKTYRKALDQYVALFPDEPTPYLLMTSVYADTKEYDRYISAVDRLDTLLSIDPFLNYFRGNVEMKVGSVRRALDFYQQAFEFDPGVWQNTKALVACKIGNNELVQANTVINQYKQVPGYRKELVESIYQEYPALR
ncbi:MAG: hypothetical protein C5B59_10675 [Bacteroidetes bacterium]|nr:MAG: hypothetical protein C5B59_10675 [Bacteroidota bacterium]